MNDIYKNIEELNPNKKRKNLIVFDMLSNKKLNLMVTDIFMRGIKRNIFLVFITQSYFSVPKSTILNYSHYSL